MQKMGALAALIAAFAVLAVAGCGSSSDDSSSTEATTSSSTTDEASGSGGGGGSSGGGESIDVSLTDFKLDPADPAVKSGQVTINATNDGQTTHSIEIEGKGIEETTLPNDLAPGDKGSLTIDLPPGTYEWYCPVANHKDLGMKGEVNVQ